MKNTDFTELLFKRFSLIDTFLWLVDCVCVGLFPCLKNTKLTGVCRYGDGGNPFD